MTVRITGDVCARAAPPSSRNGPKNVPGKFCKEQRHGWRGRGGEAGPPSQQAGLTTGFVSAPSGCREVQLLAEHLQPGTGPGSRPGQGAPAPGPPAAPVPRALAAGERLATAPCGSREARGGCRGPGTGANQEHCPQTFSLAGRHCKERGTGHRCVIADRQGTTGQNREASARTTKWLCFRPPKPLHFLLLAAELKTQQWCWCDDKVTTPQLQQAGSAAPLALAQTAGQFRF